jgi:uncharacterized protein YijF (DUF1287 family)
MIGLILFMVQPVGLGFCWGSEVPETATKEIQFTSTENCSRQEFSLGNQLVAAARTMIGLETRYQMSYPRIPYPAGDISPNEGLCCDVIIRALRSVGIDLQELVYEDIQNHPDPYRRVRPTGPNNAFNWHWAHRRTAILDVFLARFAEHLTTRVSTTELMTWEPGDIVIYKRNGWETWHIAFISDITDTRSGVPMLIDAWIDPGKVSEIHHLLSYGPIGSHYRIPDSFLEQLSAEHQQRAQEAWLAYRDAERVRVASAPGSSSTRRGFRGMWFSQPPVFSFAR